MVLKQRQRTLDCHSVSNYRVQYLANSLNLDPKMAAKWWPGGRKGKETNTMARPGPAWLWVLVQDKPSRNLAGQWPFPNWLQKHTSTRGWAFWLWTRLAGRRQDKWSSSSGWACFRGVESDHWSNSKSFSMVPFLKKKHTAAAAVSSVFFPLYKSLLACRFNWGVS